MKTKRVKKHYPTDIPLAENVRLLRCGAWGYIHEKKPIFKSEDVDKVNAFSNWVQIGYFAIVAGKYICWTNEEILKEAARMQLLEGEPKILPECHLCDNKMWRVESNHYEAVVRQKY